MGWLGDRVGEQAGEGSGPLKIMYRVDGSSDLDEQTLDHFEGYAGSSPVRIGNGAADQLQLDIYGEMLDSIWLADQHGIRVGHAGWTKLSSIADWLCEHWDQPDEGVWETRGGRQNFTYGRLMCWVALDRMVRLAGERGRPADLARWISERDNIYNAIMEHGWNAERGAFTQHDQTDVLDASLLMMPLTGFVVPNDLMWLSTLDAMDGELVSDSLVYRYNPSASPDGLRGHEGTFSICTFWYVDALARSGPPGAGAGHVGEDVHLRQPPRPVRRGDRAHRRATRQLPPGVHPPVPDQRRHQSQPQTRPRRRVRQLDAAPGPKMPIRRRPTELNGGGSTKRSVLLQSSPSRKSCDRGSGSVEDLALLVFELGVGEYAGVPELAELLQLGQLVIGARGGGLGVLRLRWGLFGGGLFLLCGPPSLLAVSYTSS